MRPTWRTKRGRETEARPCSEVLVYPQPKTTRPAPLSGRGTGRTFWLLRVTSFQSMTAAETTFVLTPAIERLHLYPSRASPHKRSAFRCSSSRPAALVVRYDSRLVAHASTAGATLLTKADSFYAPIIALAVSLHGPASLRVLSHLTMFPPASPGSSIVAGSAC